MPAPLSYLLTALLAFLLAGIGTGLARTVFARRLLDVPNARSSHVQPTPRGGGVVMVAIVLAGCGAYAWLAGPSVRFAAFLLGAAVIAGISFVDDVRTLPVSLRLSVHLATAAMVVGVITAWSGIPLLPASSAINYVLSVVWVVALINAYNFMDGIDGIAGAQAVVAGIAWFVVGWLLAAPPIALTSLLVAAAAAGFLRHNWAPATIFMGDAGAAFLGYTFAALPLLLPAPQIQHFAAAVAMVGLFVVDTTFTIVRRALARERIWQAHRTHLYQRLVSSGRGHASVTGFYVALGVPLAAVGVVTAIGRFGAVIAYAAVAFAGWFVIVLVRHRERIHSLGLEQRAGSSREHAQPAGITRSG